MTYPTMYEVLRTPDSKWRWWPALQLVDCVRKGKRKPVIEISLPVQKNNEEGAILRALKEEWKIRHG